LPLRYFVEKYGPDDAKKIWEFATSGVEHIRNNIIKYTIDCDYQVQDTLVVTNTKHSFTKDIQAEYEARKKLHYSSTLYTQDQVSSILGSHYFHGAVAYPDTFGIRAYYYCRDMKKVLQDKGLVLHEETPALEIKDHIVTTPSATIHADHIIVCIDRWAATIPTLSSNVYHAQTFLLISAPLTDTQIKTIFPDRLFMTWDTDMIYHYFRATGENRLLVGGSNLLYTYAKHAKYNNQGIAKTLTHYFQKRFNIPIQDEYIWPGVLGISRDLSPIAGYDNNMPSVYYVTAATGLPWAAALGAYSAERIIDNNTSFDTYFSPYRRFPLGSWGNVVLPKQLRFALSNFMTVGSM
jgi:gamma-glutamylputrescine oxidase